MLNGQFFDGPPLEKLAPSGGSAVQAVTSVGAFGYRGRFAPSPTGPLHAGSLVAALASWLDARAHNGVWLVRMEDVDVPRCLEGIDQYILGQLSALGLVSDEAPLFQSQRTDAYLKAIESLAAAGLAYPCACSRKDVMAAIQALGRESPRTAELVYPASCRPSTVAPCSFTRFQNKTWRLRTDALKTPLWWQDRRLGQQQQDIQTAVGDFALLRADGYATYQLAVVVDDAAQVITHVVRGEDLADNTPRQILLQRSLGFAMPLYLHTPLVMGENSEKLSKQNGARALEISNPIATLNQAAAILGLRPSPHTRISDALGVWVHEWRRLYNPTHERCE